MKNKNLLGNLKPGIFIWFGWRLHISLRARLVKEAGFDATCLWWADEEKANTGSLDDLPQIVRDAGLEIDNIHVPFTEAHLLLSDNPSERKKIIGMHKTWIEDCARHKIPKMVLHICPLYKDPPQPNNILLDNLSEILKFAESAKVILAAENTWRADYIDFALDRLDSDYLCFCYDCGHDFLLSKEPAQILKRWGHKLTTTHLHDNKSFNDDHMLPFTGNNDWKKVTENWPKDYKGFLMLEVLGDITKHSAQEYLALAFESVTKLKDI
ncbi:MAG: sugar phosphate isomerase/epimerase [Sedimentisphaerales bacterium]|nr:sugar phosphate isomerase/epimerase [Sedimentisphaerales bacterium]